MFECGVHDTDEQQNGAADPVCWGAQVHGGVECTPHFQPGKLHFKNKFCDSCRSSIMVSLTQVRALSEEQAAFVVNKRSEGFWNHAPASMGGGQYRIINNTAGCIGPWLALFREQPPHLLWPAVPDNWVTADGYLRLCVAKGTLVPAKSLRCGQPQASAKRRKVEPAAMPQLTLADQRASLPPIPGQLATPMVDAQTHQVQPPLHAQRVMAYAVPAGPVVSVMATARAPSTRAAVASPVVGGQRSIQSVQSVTQGGIRGGMQGGIHYGMQGGMQGEMQGLQEQGVQNQQGSVGSLESLAGEFQEAPWPRQAQFQSVLGAVPQQVVAKAHVEYQTGASHDVLAWQYGPHGGLQGGSSGMRGAEPPLAACASALPPLDEAEAHVAAQLHEYRSKLQEYKAQLQLLQSKEEQGRPQDAPAGNASFGFAPGAAPRSEVAAGSESHMTPAACGDEAGAPSPQQPVSNISDIAATPTGTPQKRKADDPADEVLTTVPRGARTASANELGRDLASSAEVWRACQAAAGVEVDVDDDAKDDDVADDSLDASRASTVGTVSTVVVDNGGGQDKELHNSLDSHATAAAAADDGHGPMPEGGVFEVLHSAYRHLTGTLHTLLEDGELSDVQRELVCRHLHEMSQFRAELMGGSKPLA